MDYNNLTDMDDFHRPKDLSEHVDKLGKIFVKFGVQDKVMLTLVHRHCELNDGEYMVETEYEDRLVTSPKPFVEARSPKACMIDKNGIVPFEYRDIPLDTSLPGEFLEEMYTYLVETNLLSILGIAFVGPYKGLAIEKTVGRDNILTKVNEIIV